MVFFFFFSAFFLMWFNFLGDYPYAEGSSSSDGANSSISENTEPGLDLSSDDEEEEDDDEDEDEDVEDNVGVTAKELHRNSDNIMVNDMVETHGKTPNLISAKGELNKVNGLKMKKKVWQTESEPVQFIHKYSWLGWGWKWLLWQSGNKQQQFK